MQSKGLSRVFSNTRVQKHQFFSAQSFHIEPSGSISACVISYFSRVRLFATPLTVARQAPLSVGFSRQEYWSGLPCPPPGDLLDSGAGPASLVSPALAGRFFIATPSGKSPGSRQLWLSLHPLMWSSLPWVLGTALPGISERTRLKSSGVVERSQLEDWNAGEDVPGWATLSKKSLTSRSPFPYLGDGDRKPVGLCGSAECTGAKGRAEGLHVAGAQLTPPLLLSH